MCGARLDLLRQSVDVAEAPLEGATREDRIHPGGFIGEVRHLDRRLDRMRAAQAQSGTLRHW